jgi:hypothetical protein
VATIDAARALASAECHACLVAADSEVTSSVADGVANVGWWECAVLRDGCSTTESSGPLVCDAGMWKEYVYFIMYNGNREGCIRESTIAGCAVSPSVPTTRKDAALPATACHGRRIATACCNMYTLRGVRHEYIDMTVHPKHAPRFTLHSH